MSLTMAWQERSSWFKRGMANENQFAMTYNKNPKLSLLRHLPLVCHFPIAARQAQHRLAASSPARWVTLRYRMFL